MEGFIRGWCGSRLTAPGILPPAALVHPCTSQSAPAGVSIGVGAHDCMEKVGPGRSRGWPGPCRRYESMDKATKWPCSSGRAKQEKVRPGRSRGWPGPCPSREQRRSSCRGMREFRRSTASRTASAPTLPDSASVQFADAVRSYSALFRAGAVRACKALLRGLIRGWC